MSAAPLSLVPDRPTWSCTHEQLAIATTRELEFVDITPRIEELVRRCGLTHGVVNLQTRHTTTAIVVNENEPLLLRDIEGRLRVWAPEWVRYRHDDFAVRTVNLTETERANGHAHARAIVLGTSESLNVVDGALFLGRWQRVFLLELDGPQERRVSVMALGEHARGTAARASAALRRSAGATPETEAARCG